MSPFGAMRTFLAKNMPCLWFERANIVKNGNMAKELQKYRDFSFVFKS
jgi:hypothetical protein